MTEGAVRRGCFFVGLLGVGAALAAVAGATPSSVELVFDGHHGPPLGAGFRHEGPFTATPPFCSSGTVVDLLHQGQRAAIRLHTCADGSGTFTMRVTDFIAEHVTGGTGTWQVTEGTGGYATLRGKGTWTSVSFGGADERFRSTLRGIADLDNVPPTIAISRATATKLRRPKGAYVIRVAFSARDNVAGNVVSYRVTATAGTNNWSRAGQTASGPVTLSLQVRPPKNARRVRLEIRASDPLENERRVARWLKL